MAGKPNRRLTTRQVKSHTDSIQTSKILKRLAEHVFSKEDTMTASQVNAAKLLLGKVLPDLKAIDNQSSDGSMSPPSEIEITIVKAKA